jgi:hypothetical protein
MADPFSILVGTAGLLDVLIRAAAYLADVHEAAGKVEEDIAFLSRDIQALTSVNESIGILWESYKGAATGTEAANAGLITDT